jgi:hypothetical protein
MEISMNKYLTLSASALLLSGLVLMTGCSSSSDGGTTPPTVATVPANATVIDDNNAEPMVASIATSLNAFDQALAVQTTPVMGLSAALDIVKPLIKNSSKNSGIDLANGVAYSEGGACTDGGTFSVTGDETDDGTNYSDTFTATFSNCIEFDFTIDGTISGTFTENYSTGGYTDNVTGSLSITIVSGTETIKVSFTGINFQESGNNFDGTYTTSQATFALVIEVNGTTQFAYLAELTAPVVESSGGEFSCPESGTIKITGGNDTTAEGIYNGDGTMTIKANGAVVNPSAPCYN